MLQMSCMSSGCILDALTRNIKFAPAHMYLMISVNFIWSIYNLGYILRALQGHVAKQSRSHSSGCWETSVEENP